MTVTNPLSSTAGNLRKNAFASRKAWEQSASRKKEEFNKKSFFIFPFYGNTPAASVDGLFTKSRLSFPEREEREATRKKRFIKMCCLRPNRECRLNVFLIALFRSEGIGVNIFSVNDFASQKIIQFRAISMIERKKISSD